MLQGTFQNRIIQSAIFLFILFQLIFGVIPGWSDIQSDFPNYYVAAQLIHSDKDSLRLYDNDWFQEQILSHGIKAQGKFAPFPPPTAFILYPLTFLEPLSAKRVWLCFNLLLIPPVILLMRKVSGTSSALCTLLLTGSGLTLANNLMLGQVYLLLLISMLISMILLQGNSRWIPGALLGFGIAVKYFPLVFIPGLIRAKKWIVLAWIVFTLFLLNFLALLIFGMNTYTEFLDHVLFRHFAGELEGQSPWSSSFQSWNSLAHVMFRYHVLENPDPLINSNLLFNLMKIGIPLFILTLTGYVFTGIRGNKMQMECSVMLLSAMILFLTPAGATYHHLLLILPLTLYLRIFRPGRGLFNTSFLILFLCLSISGIFPLLLNKIPHLSENLVLRFHRLCLSAVFYLVIVRQLLWLSGKENSENSTQSVSG
jgi:hypothetical protein